MKEKVIHLLHSDEIASMYYVKALYFYYLRRLTCFVMPFLSERVKLCSQTFLSI